MLEELVARYGYAAVLAGTFLEGETILVLAGVAARVGYLDIWLVMLAAFAGSFAGDQIYFFFGRRYGERLLARWPTWRIGTERVNRLLRQYDTWFILGFRFVYGIRSISPFAIGMSGVSPVRFFFLNVIAAALWAGVLGGASFALGHVAQLFLQKVEFYEWYLFGIVAAAGLLVWTFHIIRTRRRARRYRAREAGGADGPLNG